MNEKIDLVEILKDAPKGTKLYTPLVGNVLFYEIAQNNCLPIRVKFDKYGLTETFMFTKDGRKYHSPDGECLLFPSKDQRDWSKFKPKKPKFDPKTLNPFDKVLVRDHYKTRWTTSLFSYVNDDGRVYAGPSNWIQVIPYNDETKNLLGKLNEAPEYYRYWEN